MKFERITVIGAGAIGGWIAAKLALAGNEVMALTSRGAIDQLEIDEAGETRAVRLSRFDGPGNLVILAVKAPALPALASSLKASVGPDTVVVPMLNGVPWWFLESQPLLSVDPEGNIAGALPLDRVVGCVVHASCSRSSPNLIDVKHAEKLIIGERGGETSERAARLFGLLDHAGLKPDMTGNIRRAIWYKLWGNATINPLSA